MEKVNLETVYDRYLAYLNSQKWAELRNAALERDEYHCSICGCPEALEVHHLKYPDTLGTEPLSDLMTLCHDCHVKLEAYKKGHVRSPRTYLWSPPKCEYWVRVEPTETVPDIDDIIDDLTKNVYLPVGKGGWGSSIKLWNTEKDCPVTVFADCSYLNIEEFDRYVQAHYPQLETRRIKRS